jgi:outer membrane protein OmpA-like peptidoglycan-associated protein
MGPGTRQAIQQFQMQQQLPSTGMLDDITVSTLQAACSGQQAAQDGAGAFPPAPPAPQPPAPQAPAPQQPTGRRHAANPPAGQIGESEFDQAPGAGTVKFSAFVLWFEWNSTKLRQDAEVDSVVQLAMVIKEALQHLRIAGKAGRIVLHGYSSREGAEEHNRNLALQRAQRVKDLLVDGGVPEGRIQVIGHGANSDWSTLKSNRRVALEFQP